MEKVDVLIVYETKVRELESICLLKYELERRGYSVAIINTWNEIYGAQKHSYDAKVVVAPSMYNDGIYDFLKSFCGNVRKVVNLQWEQIGPVGDRDKPDAWYVLKGMASQCVNVCWGINTFERLLNRANIDEDHLCLSGHIALDYSRPELIHYYKSKEDILKKYSLPVDKGINLFISSFSYVNLPKTLEDQSLFSEVDKFKNASIKSFEGVVSWFERFLKDNDDQIIIYRPHPSEAANEILRNMQKRFIGRFFVISELSVKQWILISDRVYTWYSTSSAEAYAFKKPIAVLRPYQIPKESETELLEDFPKTTTYDEFEKSTKGEIDSSLSDSVIKKYYYFGEKPAYITITDAIEKVYKDDSYLIKDEREHPKKKPVTRAKEAAHSALSFIASYMPDSVHFIDKYRQKSTQNDKYTDDRIKANYASEEEIHIICNRIKELLES